MVSVVYAQRQQLMYGPISHYRGAAIACAALKPLLLVPVAAAAALSSSSSASSRSSASSSSSSSRGRALSVQKKQLGHCHHWQQYSDPNGSIHTAFYESNHYCCYFIRYSGELLCCVSKLAAPLLPLCIHDAILTLVFARLHAANLSVQWCLFNHSVMMIVILYKVRCEAPYFVKQLCNC
jgi:hypothetical protein